MIINLIDTGNKHELVIMVMVDQLVEIVKINLNKNISGNFEF